MRKTDLVARAQKNDFAIECGKYLEVGNTQRVERRVSPFRKQTIRKDEYVCCMPDGVYADVAFSVGSEDVSSIVLG